jgi:hypothetical protein
MIANRARRAYACLAYGGFTQWTPQEPVAPALGRITATIFS